MHFWKQARKGVNGGREESLEFSLRSTPGIKLLWEKNPTHFKVLKPAIV